MGLLGGIIGGIGSAVSGIVSGNATRKAAKRNERILNKAQERSQNWYDKEYNADFLQRSDAQSAVNQARKILDERYRNAQGAAAVAGATDESVALQKQAANQTLADITGSIAERADQYKEQVRANYENQQNAIDQARMGVNNQKAQATAQAAGGLAQAAQSLGGVVSDDILKGASIGIV